MKPTLAGSGGEYGARLRAARRRYDWTYHGTWPTNAGGVARIVVEEARFGPTEREDAVVLRELVEPPHGGFGWGYNGSGTSTSAASVLADALELGDPQDCGLDGWPVDDTLIKLREDFCWDVLAELCDDWRLRRGTVLRWVRGWYAEHGITDLPRAVACPPPINPYE